MNKTFLTAASVIAIMASGPVFADTTVKTEDTTKSFSENVKDAWKGVKKDTSEAASSVSNATKDAYNNVKQALSDNDEDAEFKKISIDSRMTATGMIGQPIYNVDGERVAKIRDIIMDADGQALMVVVGDGDFTGLGKLVAFDYNIITTRNSNGDVIAALTEEMIDSAASFSYNRDDYSESVRVIPSSGYSVAEILDGELVDPKGTSLAYIDNVVFREGAADQVVVSFGTTMGLGGEQAAIAYGEADLKRDGNSMNMQLSKSETVKFQKYKETAFN